MKAATRKALLHEMHSSIEEAASSLFDDLDNSKLSYPPGVNLTVPEQRAIKNLKLSSDAKSAFKKLVMDSCSYPCFHLLCLVDGVADPESEEIDEWLGLSITEAGVEEKSVDDDNNMMLHDEFGESYWDYKKLKSEQ